MNKVVELVKIWGNYEEDHPGLSIEDFCIRYLSDRSQKVEHDSDAYGMSARTQLLSLCIRLNKFAGIYAKKALKKFNFNTEDWFYLISLIDQSTPKKSELIHQHLSEFPSGIEIIKRLLKAGLIEELPDETDKRSKRLKITSAGLGFLAETLPDMNKIGPMAFGTLSDVEISMVTNILKRLDHFHEERIKMVRDASFEEAGDMLLDTI